LIAAVTTLISYITDGMAKNKNKRKTTTDPSSSHNKHQKKKKKYPNPLQTAQQQFLKSLPSQARTHFFSPTHITPEQRAEIWETQADLGKQKL